MASSDLIAISSMLPGVIYAGTLGTSSTDVVAPATNHAAIVKSVVVCNSASTSTTLTVTATKSGGSAVPIVSAFSVPAGDTVPLDELGGSMFGPGDKLSAYAGAASSLSLVITGTVNS